MSRKQCIHPHCDSGNVLGNNIMHQFLLDQPLFQERLVQVNQSRPSKSRTWHESEDQWQCRLTTGGWHQNTVPYAWSNRNIALLSCVTVSKGWFMPFFLNRKLTTTNTHHQKHPSTNLYPNRRHSCAVIDSKPITETLRTLSTKAEATLMVDELCGQYSHRNETNFNDASTHIPEFP